VSAETRPPPRASCRTQSTERIQTCASGSEPSHAAAGTAGTGVQSRSGDMDGGDGGAERDGLPGGADVDADEAAESASGEEAGDRLRFRWRWRRGEVASQIEGVPIASAPGGQASPATDCFTPCRASPAASEASHLFASLNILPLIKNFVGNSVPSIVAIASLASGFVALPLHTVAFHEFCDT